MLNDLKLRSKLMIIGVGVTLVPLVIILSAIFIQNKKVVRVGEEKSLQLVYADLEHIVDNLYAVSEQSESTRDISENIAQVSQGIQEVNENVSQSSAVAAQIAQDITTVNNSAGEISESSGQVKTSAEALSKMAKELNAVIGRFKPS